MFEDREHVDAATAEGVIEMAKKLDMIPERLRYKNFKKGEGYTYDRDELKEALSRSWHMQKKKD